MEITYKLHASQHQVYNDPSRFVILAAGRRFGKTILALVKLIIIASREPKSKLFYIAPTYRQAEMIAWKMLFEMIPPKLIRKKNEVKLEITLINGSEISLKGADNEDSLRGVGLDYVVLDEYGTMKPNVWQEIVRPMLTDRGGKALFIGTPKGKNHFWELFVKGQREQDGFKSYQMRTEDNPYIPRSEIKEAESQLNERYYRQEYLASFEDFTGLVWPEFDGKNHVIEPFPIPSYYEKLGAVDPAMTGTTAFLSARIDENGTIFIVDEYYEQNKRVSEVSESIRGAVDIYYGDPAGKKKGSERDGQLYSFFDEYLDNGITLIPAQNAINAGINRVGEFFKSGRIKIFKNCVNLIKELERYHWSEDRETVLGMSEPKPYKNFDHACDCLRYIVMTRFTDAQKPKPRSSDRAIPLAGELLQSGSDSTYEKWRNG